jgi:hypothetical protein
MGVHSHTAVREREVKHKLRYAVIAAGAGSLAVVSVIVRHRGITATREGIEQAVHNALRRDISGRIRDLIKMEYSGGEIAEELSRDWKVTTLIRALRRHKFTVEETSPDTYRISDVPLKGRGGDVILSEVVLRDEERKE